MISMEMLQDARRVLSPVINQTPVLHAPGLVPDCDFYLKADCLQKTGAFKLRGAYYKIATLSDEEKRRGVIACSAGNHAQGVGFASRDMKIPATICIPAGAPISKIQATRSYGANVVLVDGVIVIAGRYPDDVDLIDWLELPPEVLGYDWADDDIPETGGECGCGHENYAEDGCSDGAEGHEHGHGRHHGHH